MAGIRSRRRRAGDDPNYFVRSAGGNSARIGGCLRDGLSRSQNDVAPSPTSGQGLLVGFDLVTDQKTKTLLPKEKCIEFFKGCLAEGLIMMSYTPRVRVHPPLILSAEQATSALAIIDRVLERSRLVWNRRHVHCIILS